MAPNCCRISGPQAVPASGGVSGLGGFYANGSSGGGVVVVGGGGGTGSPKAREKTLPIVTLPGSAWKIFFGGGSTRSSACFLHQIVFLLVVFGLLTSALVILNLFGTIFAWQQCISTRLPNSLTVAQIRSFESPDVLDLPQSYDVSSPHDQSSSTAAVIEGSSSRSPKPRFRKEPVIDYSSLNQSWFLDQLKETQQCKSAETTDVYVFGLDKPSEEGVVRLPVDENHEIFLVSFDKDGVRRCHGGDYFETDLNGTQWKSRPPIKDMGDGGYAVKLRVDRRFAGPYTFQVILLFDGFKGLYSQPGKYAKLKLVLNVTMEFYIRESESANIAAQKRESHIKPEAVEDPEDLLPLCSTEDLQVYPWQGRWTRSKSNESCAADSEGRWRCLDPDEPCERPWCEGPVGRLESNGWAYSAHCHFRIFTQDEAWQCLAGKHLFFWGDSNHPDTTRNLANFLLGGNFGNLRRIYNKVFSNPSNEEQQVRFTVLFNGHVVMKFNNMGLSVLRNESYASSVRKILDPNSGSHIPDAIILNSGIHDGIWWRNVDEYVSAASDAASFWAEVWRNTSSEPSERPKVVYRTTIAPAGQSRSMPANPQKMEVLNAIIVENMVKAFGRQNLRIVDEFDMTFPFHYDNFYSDGGHYGRIPNPNSWWPGGHMYFVDVMLAHILLNSLCPL